MIFAILLIIVPGFAWERVVSARRGVLSITLFFLLPLVAATSIGEAYGLVHFGKEQATYKHTGQYTKLTPAQATSFELIQAAGSLAIIFLCAYVVKSLCETFHMRHTYLQGFTSVAYGLSPMFLFRLLDMIPMLYPWIPWVIGIALSVGALYIGIPRIMNPDPSHAFGLYVMSSVLLVAATGLLQIVTAGYLMGSSKAINGVVDGLAKIIPI
jgi:hypothetical protein